MEIAMVAVCIGGPYPDISNLNIMCLQSLSWTSKNSIAIGHELD